MKKVIANRSRPIEPRDMHVNMEGIEKRLKPSEQSGKSEPKKHRGVIPFGKNPFKKWISAMQSFSLMGYYVAFMLAYLAYKIAINIARALLWNRIAQLPWKVSSKWLIKRAI